MYTLAWTLQEYICISLIEATYCTLFDRIRANCLHCSETMLTGEFRFHTSTPLGIWTWVPCDGKQTGSPLDQWDMVKMKWDCRFSTTLKNEEYCVHRRKRSPVVLKSSSMRQAICKVFCSNQGTNTYNGHVFCVSIHHIDHRGLVATFVPVAMPKREAWTAGVAWARMTQSWGWMSRHLQPAAESPPFALLPPLSRSCTCGFRDRLYSFAGKLLQLLACWHCSCYSYWHSCRCCCCSWCGCLRHGSWLCCCW
jgi:hypothetical protein